MARVLVAVAWPYANSPIHIGYLAGSSLPGDIFARFHRLRGDEVLMVSGSDMHGAPITFAADKEGVSPQVVAERNHAVNLEAIRRLGISFDLFTTTHTAVHERVTQEIFLVLLQNGFIDRRTEDNPYCPKHRGFLPDRYVVGRCPHCGFESARGDECDNCGRLLEPRQLLEPRCALDGTPAEFRPSEHFFLRLDKLQPALEQYLSAQSRWRPNVLRVARNFLEAGLRPRPISRDTGWGVPIPLDGYPTKRIYVWFEALVGYLSASKEWAIRRDEVEAWRRFWAPEAPVRQYYFLGKDNTFFHAILWPALLIGNGGYALPYDVVANEWMQLEGRKISKSRSSDASVFLPWLLDHYPPDQIRFYAAALAPQHHDTEFDWDEFHQLAEDVLSNQYGNLVQRVLVFARDHFDGRIPEPPEGWSPNEPSGVGERLLGAHREIGAHFEGVRLKEALERTLAEVRDGNRWFQDAQPWRATGGERARVVYESLWLLRAFAIWLSPILPFSSALLYRMLGYEQDVESARWDDAVTPPPANQKLGEVRPLFPRREPSIPSPSSGPSGPLTPTPTAGERGEFVPLAIRAGVVMEVNPHPQADKLYVLTVDVGEPKPRTVVAGIRPYYRPEELTGHRVAVLTNLQPRTIRRMTSQGMVLAADNGQRVELVEPPEAVAPGQLAEDVSEPTLEIAYPAFESNPLVVGVVTEAATDGQVAVEIGGRRVFAHGDWPVGTRVVVQLDGPAGVNGRVIHFARDLLLLPGTGLPPGTRVR